MYRVEDIIIPFQNASDVFSEAYDISQDQRKEGNLDWFWQLLPVIHSVTITMSISTNMERNINSSCESFMLDNAAMVSQFQPKMTTEEWQGYLTYNELCSLDKSVYIKPVTDS
jgi:hypothetical protein